MKKSKLYESKKQIDSRKTEYITPEKNRGSYAQNEVQQKKYKDLDHTIVLTGNHGMCEIHILIQESIHNGQRIMTAATEM